MEQKNTRNLPMKCCQEWLPGDLCSKKLAVLLKNLEVAICSALP
jgi:hypothetical protein